MNEDQPNPLYTVAAVEIEKPASTRGESSPEGGRSPTPPAGFDDRFAQMVAAVKGEGGSIAVDPETGALLVAL